MRRHISCLIILSFACMRSRRVFLLIWNLPWRVLPQMKVKLRKLKVSGLPSPRRWRRSAAKRPNSMSRVFSGCSVSANFSNRSRISSRKRRDYRALPRPPVTDGHDPIFHDACLEPFADQADDAPVADPMLHEPDEPFLAHRVEERVDVGVQYEAHVPAVDTDAERIQRVVR